MNTLVNDIKVYQAYENFISNAYPTFLRKLGVNNIAVNAYGACIVDSSGKEYIDCISGYGVFNLGHNHPTIVESLIDHLRQGQLQTKPLITEISIVLAKMLADIAPGELSCSFVCNSGSEAIDSAIKLARVTTRKKHIIAAKKSFHGFTLGALSVSGIPLFKKPFEPLVPDISHVQYGDLNDLNRNITTDTAAVLLEPIQHEAGIVVPSESYFKEVRRICDENNTLLIIDEIKTGFGKTGYMFAAELFDIVPDILVVGKSLGGGLVPIGAMIAKKDLWRKFSLSFPMSASSYAGNGLACRAALATIMLLKDNNLMEECRKKSHIIIQNLQKFILLYPSVLKNVDGVGLLIGVETVHPSKAIAISIELIRQGVLAVQAFAHSSTIMIEPPLVISYVQIEYFLRVFKNSCDELSRM